MNSAAFSLEGYIFDKVEMDLSTLKPKTTFNIGFAPSGKFSQDKSQFIDLLPPIQYCIVNRSDALPLAVAFES